MTASTPRNARVIPARRGARNVYVHLAVRFAAPDGHDLHLQIIQPSGDAAMLGRAEAFANRYPCVVFVQGSGWREQALGTAIAPLCRFAERGFVIAIAEYRPSTVAPFPAQVQDAKTAVRWLREHADSYSVDADRMVIAGDSSGGHTALLVHATDGLAVLDDDPRGAPLRLRGAVSLYGPTDLMAMRDDEAVRQVIGASGEQEFARVARAANPLTYVDADRALAPVLLAHGTEDDVVPCVQSVDYAHALTRMGHRPELVLVDGAHHGGWPSFFTRELADLVEGFLRVGCGLAGGDDAAMPVR